MPNNTERILSYLTTHPEGGDDDELSATLGIRPRQQVNQICRRLAAEGRITRKPSPLTGKLVNVLASQKDNDTRSPGAQSPQPPPHPDVSTVTSSTLLTIDAREVPNWCYQGELGLSEDVVKQALATALSRDGWRVTSRMGHEHGIDIDAHRGAERWVIEAKGEGSRDPMRVNYFLSGLGELLQRMDTPDANYALALPAHRQFSGLIARLPIWVRGRLGLNFFLVRPNPSGGYEVGHVTAGRDQ